MDRDGFLLDGEWHPLASTLEEALMAEELIEQLHFLEEWEDVAPVDKMLLIRSCQKFGLFT